MSSTSRGGQRHPDDWYRTPSAATRPILPWIIGPGMQTVLDPACGDGAILDDVRASFPRLRTLGFEIDPSRAATCGVKGHVVLHGDALTRSALDWRADIIVMNPPFALAMPFIERALGTDAPVACLLRIAYLASQKRAQFWRDHPADVFVLPRRPSFTSDGKTDSADYMWAVWGPGRGGRWQVLGEPTEPKPTAGDQIAAVGTAAVKALFPECV